MILKTKMRQKWRILFNILFFNYWKLNVKNFLGISLTQIIFLGISLTQIKNSGIIVIFKFNNRLSIVYLRKKKINTYSAIIYKKNLNIYLFKIIEFI